MTAHKTLRRPASEQTLVLPNYLLYLGMLWVCAWFNEGWMQPDEHSRTLEPALFILKKMAALPWEFTDARPMVSFLIGMLHAPILYVGESLNLSPMGEAALLRAFSATVASTQLWAMASLLKGMFGPGRQAKFWLIAFAFNPMVPLLLTRTSQENWGTTAMLWGLVGLCQLPHGPKPSTKRLFWGACALSLATSFRLQLGPGIACLMLWAFITRTSGRDRMALVLGAILGLVPMAIVDTFMVGMPFKPAFNYLQYALGDEEGGAVWGTNPWYDYVIHYLGSWYPPLSPLLVWPMALGLIRFPQVGLILIPFMGVHFILGHKEARYLSPMVPLALLAMAQGWEMFKLNWVKRAFPYIACAAAVICSPMWVFPQNFAPRFYVTMGQLAEQEPIIYVGKTRSGPASFYTRLPPTLWRFLDLDEFVLGVEGKKPLSPGLYGIYRVDTKTLSRIIPRCPVEYESSPPIWRWALSMIPKSAHWQRTDVIVRCGSEKV